MSLASLFLNLLAPFSTFWLSHLTPAPPATPLLGRWEVVAYSEQGVAVDKKSDPLRQAVAVYSHLRKQRALLWYGYDEDGGERRRRAYERWEERDSLREVQRLAEVIGMPYFAVFFADSTLALYNKDVRTNRITNAEARHYNFSPAFMSLDISYAASTVKWSDAQILALTEQRLTLFIPEEGEIVELVKTAYTLP